MQWVTICSTTNSRSVQWVTIASPQHHQFVLWVTMCFLSQAKSLWKKYLNKRRRTWKHLKKKDSQIHLDGSILQNDTAVQCWKKMGCTGLQRINKTRTIQGAMMTRTFSGVFFETWCFLDELVSQHQRLMCLEVQVPSPSQVASTTRRRTSIGETQWARQSPDFAPEIKGTHCVFYREVLQLASSIWKIPTCASGDRMHIISKPQPLPPPDRLYPGQIQPDRASCDPLLSSHPWTR